jgi:hypothetical protein
MSLRKRRPGLVYPTNEDWRYVGDTGEPAFGTDWGNSLSDQNLAFRIRETGIVDIQGSIENTASPSVPSTSVVFTLPVGYRPSAKANYSCSGSVATSGALVPVRVTISTGGTVDVGDARTSPYPVAGVTTVLRRVVINGQFFLTPPSAP